MIAYLFWHWPSAESPDDAGYEGRQAAFHAALAESGAEGFVESRRYRVEGAGWLPGGRGYEDWYLVEGSFALDPLNEAAVGARAGAEHAAAAAGAEGLGGLYRLQRGVPRAASATVSWLSKPRGEDYRTFYERFGGEVVLWRRMMVLGPAPEFLLEGPAPAGLEAQAVWRRLLT